MTHLRGLVRKGALVLTIGGLMTGALAACGSSSGSSASGGSSASKGPIMLGESNSLTGDLAASCSPTNSGFLAWVKSVNAAGGVQGRQIDVKVLDDAGDPATAVGNVRQFKSDGVTAVVASCGLKTAGAMGPALNSDKIPYLFPDASVPALASPVLPYVFNLLPLYNNEMAGITKAAMTKYGPGSNYFQSLEIPGTDVISASIEAATKAAGGTFLGTELLPAGPPNVTPYVTKVAQLKPDYLSMINDVTDGNRIVAAMASQGVLPKHILAFGGFESTQYSQGLPESAQKITLIASPISPVGSPQTQQCETVLTKYKVAINGQAIVGCAQGQAVVAALKAANGNYTSANILQALNSMQNVKIGDEIGPLSFSSTDHVGIHQEFVVTVSNNVFSVSGTFTDQ
jgi:branched-chain amino acid transport system substrate-binding protein